MNFIPWGNQWNEFWFKPMDPIRFQMFRMAHGICLLLYMGAWWMNAREWLTPAGFHSSSQVEAVFRFTPLPLLPESVLPWFGLLLFSSIGAWIIGWQLRWTTWIALGCVIYVTFVDRVSAYTINKLFIVSLAVCALAPKSGVMPSWPVRVLQLTLIIMYFTAGWCKAVHGEWLDNPHVLWTQVHGFYRTGVAAWMLHILPQWTWSVMQYASLAFELGAPLLFGVRKFRKAGFLGGILFQGLIALTMYQLIWFSLQMLSFYILFMDGKILETRFTPAT